MIPTDFPVKVLHRGTEAYDNAGAVATCGSCGRSWDDSIPTSWTPVPGGRCPFEYHHDEDPRITLRHPVRQSIRWTCGPDATPYVGRKFWPVMIDGERSGYFVVAEISDGQGWNPPACLLTLVHKVDGMVTSWHAWGGRPGDLAREYLPRIIRRRAQYA